MKIDNSDHLEVAEALSFQKPTNPVSWEARDVFNCGHRKICPQCSSIAEMKPFILNKQLSQQTRSDRLVFYEHPGKYNAFDRVYFKFENPLKILRSFSSGIYD